MMRIRQSILHNRGGGGGGGWQTRVGRDGGVFYYRQRLHAKRACRAALGTPSAQATLVQRVPAAGVGAVLAAAVQILETDGTLRRLPPAAMLATLGHAHAASMAVPIHGTRSDATNAAIVAVKDRPAAAVLPEMAGGAVVAVRDAVLRAVRIATRAASGLHGEAELTLHVRDRRTIERVPGRRLEAAPARRWLATVWRDRVHPAPIVRAVLMPVALCATSCTIHVAN